MLGSCCWNRSTPSLEPPDSSSTALMLAARLSRARAVTDFVTQWIEEVRSICGPSIPVILVALKIDLRDKAIANGTFTPDNFIDTETVSHCALLWTFVPPRTQSRERRVSQSLGKGTSPPKLVLECA